VAAIRHSRQVAGGGNGLNEWPGTTSPGLGPSAGPSAQPGGDIPSRAGGGARVGAYRSVKVVSCGSSGRRNSKEGTGPFAAVINLLHPSMCEVPAI
jgi:hypothetical protein